MIFREFGPSWSPLGAFWTHLVRLGGIFVDFGSFLETCWWPKQNEGRELLAKSLDLRVSYSRRPQLSHTIETLGKCK